MLDFFRQGAADPQRAGRAGARPSGRQAWAQVSDSLSTAATALEPPNFQNLLKNTDVWCVRRPLTGQQTQRGATGQ